MTALIDVYNAGLAQVSASPIAASELTTPVTPNGVIIARDGQNWIQDVMRSVDWACLTARQVLLNNGTVSLTLSSAAVGNGVTATPASSYFNARDVGRYLYEVGSGLSGSFLITSIGGGPPLVATGNVLTAFAGVALAAQGWTLDPLSSGKSAYTLPSDCLKVRGISDEGGYYSYHHYRHWNLAPIEWQVEDGQLLTDAVRATAPNTNTSATYPVLVYTYYESTPDNWDKSLLQAIQARIAAEMAWPVSKNETVLKDKWSIYNKKIVEADGITRTDQQRRGLSRYVLIGNR